MPMLHRRSFTDEQFVEAVKTSNSIAQVIKKLELRIAGANYRATKILIEKFSLDTSHFTGQGFLKGKTHDWGKGSKLEDILLENSTYTNLTCLKRRLLKELKWEYKCVECGLSNEWNNKNLSLHLDHINGNNRDHRKENLRFLCPNCHSQTTTYCGKNK
jgi:Zn finger protein HypA/HybF involved in hydrogenase expression